MNNFYKRLVDIYELLNSGANINKSLDYIYENMNCFIPIDRISIVLRDFKGALYLYALKTEIESEMDIGFFKDISTTSLKKVIFQNKPRIIDDYEKYLEKNPESEMTKTLIDNNILSSVAYPLIANSVTIGTIIFSSKEKNVYKEEHINYIKLLSTNIAISLEKNFFVDDLILASITGFAKLVEAKDSDTGYHIERVQDYSKIIASTLSKTNKYSKIINKKFISDIYKFSPLHDIGKVGIADGILLKPSKLTREEFEVMKMHTVIGAHVLRKSSKSIIRRGRHFFDMGIEIALSHHERFNGEGYPYGLSGENIPISARIVILSDVLDALTSKRVYKKAFSIELSFQIIKDEKGKMFDPYVVDALFESKKKIINIYNRLNEGLDFSNI